MADTSTTGPHRKIGLRLRRRRNPFPPFPVACLATSMRTGLLSRIPRQIRRFFYRREGIPASSPDVFGKRGVEDKVRELLVVAGVRQPIDEQIGGLGRSQRPQGLA